MSLAGSSQDTAATVGLAMVLIGIPLLTLLAILSGAWLTWGKPRTT